ncbi:hypothetical protein BIT28_16055 [Photobacterium proteolyticum]|uniref:N-acetyltransferase domain-containing protein n=1 Tax=Photobacterium proteolyticum TaxID=1903952 RepID=A0A1Q9GZ00_9GAMM|nr:GNAT family N-acetyltransferase [Photobacterium proteolyticum]OLQ80580.1 hypothetical protein BIT28_16055 [Photobacterium proteolyticum]
MERIYELNQVIYDKQADAFIADPLFSLFTTDIKARKRAITSICLLAVYNSKGETFIYTADSSYNALAIWERVGVKKLRNPFKVLYCHYKMITSGCIKEISTYGKRLSEIQKRIDLNKRRSDYYLNLLFVAPEYQGRGLASELMKPMLSYMDENQFVCSTDTNNEENVSMYEHYGFSIVEKVQLIEGVTNYILRREPLECLSGN